MGCRSIFILKNIDMANKKEYTIVINGIKESYEGVKSLAEALDSLKDTVIKVAKEEEKSAGSKKSATSSTDALAKAQEKLANYDKAYQEELAKTNAKLSANKKEINELIKVQQAEITVGGNVGTSYREKQQYLSALNTLIRNNTLETEEQNRKQQEWIQKSAELQQELKDIDSEMKIYVRNVGNYQGAADTVIDSHKSLKQELKELKTAMAEMLANGVSKTDEGYLKLAERAGQLKDAMGDASKDIANFASDTRGLSNAINLATSAVNAYQLYNSALQVFGFENENAAESMQKMMAIMTLLNSLQQVQNSLLENGSATARLYSKSVELIKDMLGLKKAAVEADTASTEANSVANETNSATAEANAVANEAASAASETNTAVTGANTAAQGTNTAAVGTNTGAVGTNTAALGANTTANQTATTATNSLSVAQKAGAVASKTLSVALRAIPLMFIIGLVISLIQNWESIWNWFKKTFPVLDTLSKKFNKFGGFMNTVIAIAKGLGKAIINWVVTPFQTLGQVIGKILEGDFVGAAKVAINNVKGMFTGFGDEIRKELKGAAEGAAEDAAKARMKKEHEVTEYQLQELQARKGNQAKYSKEGIALQKKEFEQRKALAKGNADELKKIHLEELSFQRECQEQQTKAAEQGAKARAAAAKKAADEAKKAADEAAKEEKRRAELIKDAQEQIKNVYDIIKKAREARNETEFKDLAKEAEKIIKEYTDDIDVAITKSHQMKNLSGEGLDLELEAIRKFTAKRRLIVANELAFEVQAEKDKTEMVIKNAKAEIERLNKEEKKATGAYLESIQTEKAALEGQIADAEAKLDKYFGGYNKKAINIPIVLDIDALYDGFDKIYSSASETIGKATEQMEEESTEAGKQILQNQIDNAKKAQELMKLWRPDNLVDAFLGVDGALQSVYDNVVKYYNKLDSETMATTEESDVLLNVLDQMGEAAGFSNRQMGLIRANFIKMIGDGKDVENEILPAVQTMFAGIKSQSDKLRKDMSGTWEGTAQELDDAIDDIISSGDIFDVWSVQLNKFGDLSYEKIQQLKALGGEWDEEIKKIANAYIASANVVLTTQDKIIKRQQDATKELKFEPVMEDDAFTKLFGGQILSIDKTKERYAELKKTYQDYLDTIDEGSDQMIAVENAWQTKLDATMKLYGEESAQYQQMKLDYESAMRTYVQERNKTSQQIKQIEKKEGEVTRDYYESLEKQMKSVYSQLAENVFEPLADGFGALLDFQLEKAQEALEEIEELLDKATEAREESAERMKEINEELRADDGRNKEALQQRLAEEEVLLVQREETERALEKEKKKREYEVDMAEYNQRRFELGQKLIEGIVNTALGVTAALKYGPILGPIFAAIIGAMGALQTGIIAKQIGQVKMPQKFAKGGRIGEQGFSRSHSQGGHRIEGTNIEVEGQEWVVNKKSSKKYNTLLNAINDDNAVEIKRQVEMLKPSTVNNYVTNNYQNQRQFAGKQIVKYATGGQLNYSEAARTVEENRDAVQLAQLIKQINFTPQVAVTDINRVSKRLVKVQDLARG